MRTWYLVGGIKDPHRNSAVPPPGAIRRSSRLRVSGTHLEVSAGVPMRFLQTPLGRPGEGGGGPRLPLTPLALPWVLLRSLGRVGIRGGPPPLPPRGFLRSPCRTRPVLLHLLVVVLLLDYLPLRSRGLVYPPLTPVGPGLGLGPTVHAELGRSRSRTRSRRHSETPQL